MQVFPLFIPHFGCPHRCLFCQQERTTGQKDAWNSARIAETLDRLLPAVGSGEVAFYGGTFTMLPTQRQREYLEVACSFVDSGRISGIRVSTRPDALEPAHIDLLREFPVRTVEIGCQSFSSGVLDASGRGHGPQAAEKAVSRLREAGFTIGLQLMPGLPGANRNEALTSLGRSLELKPDFLRIYPTVVLAGSALETLFRKGKFRPMSLEEAVDLCAEMLWRCHRAAIPVIRLGLQATPELDSGNGVVAGPYHPAFGQLVRSRLWRRAMERGIKEGLGDRVAVCSRELSDALGHRRQNMGYVQNLCRGFYIESRGDVPLGHMRFGSELFSFMEMASYQGRSD